MEKVLIKNPKSPNDTVAYVLTDDFVYKDLYNKYDDSNETIWKTANYKKYNQYINECVEYQLYAQKCYDADDCDKGDTHEDDYPKITFKCYICNVDVPLKYSENHRRSKYHITCLKLANNVMQRMTDHIAQQLDCNIRTETRVIDDHLFCDICNLEIPLNKRTAHDKSNEHLLLNKKASHLMKLVKVYTGNDGADGIAYDTADKQKDKVQNTETNNLYTTSSGIVDVSDKINEKEGEFSTCYMNGAKTELQQHYNSKNHGNHSSKINSKVKKDPKLNNLTDTKSDIDNVTQNNLNATTIDQTNLICHLPLNPDEVSDILVIGEESDKNICTFINNEYTHCDNYGVPMSKGNVEHNVIGDNNTNNYETKLNTTPYKNKNEKGCANVFNNNVKKIKQVDTHFCYVCNVEIPITGIIEHFQGISHNTLANNKYKYTNCDICDIYVRNNDLDEDAFGNAHILNTNLLSFNNNETMANATNAPVDRNNKKEHVTIIRYNVKEIKEINNILNLYVNIHKGPIEETTSKVNILGNGRRNKINFNIKARESKNSAFCSICNAIVPRPCILVHIQGRHRINLFKKQCFICNVPISNDNFEQDINENIHKLNVNVSVTNNNGTELNATKRSVEKQNEIEYAIITKAKVKEIKQENDSPVEITINKVKEPDNEPNNESIQVKGKLCVEKPILTNNDKYSNFCTVCKSDVSKCTHPKGMTHCWLFSDKINDLTHCDICDVPISKGNMEHHVNVNKHKRNINLLVTNNDEIKPNHTPVERQKKKEPIIIINDNVKEFKRVNKVLSPYIDRPVGVTTNKDPGIEANNKSVQVKDQINRVVEKPIPNSTNNDTHLIFCSICKVNVPRTGILEHIEGKSHKKVYASNKNEYTHCDICDVPISKGNMEEHVNGNKHKLNLNLLVANQSQTNPIPTPVEKQIKKELITIINDNVKEYKQANDASNPYINRPEGVTTNKDPGNKTNNKSVQEKDINGVVEEPTPSSMNNDTHFIFCSICNVYVPRRGILVHVKGKSHKKVFASNKNEYTHCDICDVPICKGNMEQHVIENKHKLNLNLLVANQSQTNAIPTPVEKQIKKELITIINDNVKEYKQANDASNPYINRPEGVTTNKDPGNKTNNKSVQEKDKINGVVEEPTPSSMNNDTHFIFCSICNVNVPRRGILVHVKGKSHKKVFACNKNEYTHCDICDVPISKGNMEQHVNGNKHKLNLNLLVANQSQTNAIPTPVENQIKKEITTIINDNVKEYKQANDASNPYINRPEGVTTNKDPGIEANNKSGQVKDKLKRVVKKPIPNTSNNDPHSIFCSICNVNVPRTGIPEHIDGKSHKKILADNKNEYTHCDICDVSISKGNMEEHVNGSKHKLNLNLLVANQSQTNAIPTPVEKQIKKEIITIINDNVKEYKQANAASNPYIHSPVGVTTNKHPGIEANNKSVQVKDKINISKVNMEQHVNGNKHKLNTNLFDFKVNDASNSYIDRPVGVTTNKGPDNEPKNRTFQIHDEKNICVVKATSTTTNKDRHLFRFCVICNGYVSNLNYNEHINGIIHRRRFLSNRNYYTISDISDAPLSKVNMEQHVNNRDRDEINLNLEVSNNNNSQPNAISTECNYYYKTIALTFFCLFLLFWNPLLLYIWFCCSTLCYLIRET